MTAGLRSLRQPFSPEGTSGHGTGGGRRDHLVSAGVAAACLTVYVYTLLPGVGYSGDTAKWQFLGEVGGVPHASGYPLYLLVNDAFVTVVPWGTLAWRANLLSAVLGAVAIVLLYRLLRLLDVSWPVAASASLCFALTRTFWTQAVVAEVYTLHLALMAAVLLCLARWRLGGPRGWLLAGLGTYLLSFGNHLGTLLLLPGVVYIVWSDWRRAVSLRTALWVVGAALAGAAQYLYVLHMSRTGVYVEHQVDDLGDVLSYVTGGRFKSQMFTFTPAELMTSRLRLSGRYLVDELFVLVPVVAVGMWSQFGNGGGPAGAGRRAVVVAVASWSVTAWAFALNFDVVDVVVFFLPAFYALATFLGLGLEVLVRAARSRRPGGRRLLGAVAAGLVALPVATGLVDYRRASQRGTVEDAARIRATLEVADREAVLLTDGYDDSEYFWYFLLGEDMARSRDLALAHMVTPEQVAAFFETGQGPVADAAREVTGSGAGADRPPLYTAAASQAGDLREAGLTVSEAGAHTWRVGAPRAPPGEGPVTRRTDRAPVPGS